MSSLKGPLKNLKQNIYFKSSEKMDEFPPSSIQTIITSPPYWNLKNYEHKEQIGHGESYERYHDRLNLVWSECRKVLKDDGTLWIVVDKMLHKGQILHIPYDIVKNCKKVGFALKDIIIWNKPTAIAGMNKRNIVNKYEYVLFFSKSKNKIKLKTTSGEGSLMAPDIWLDGKKLTDLWRFPVKAGSIRQTPDHEAPFPEELIRRIILVSTDAGDVVMDPFLGSGTTMKVALELHRKCVGYEINENFAPMIAERLRPFELSSSIKPLTDWNLP